MSEVLFAFSALSKILNPDKYELSPPKFNPLFIREYSDLLIKFSLYFGIVNISTTNTTNTAAIIYLFLSPNILSEKFFKKIKH